jgi:hypothetical protein
MTVVFVTNAVRTSAGSGPGPLDLPPEEAAALVRDRHAVYGSEPPEYYLGGGGTGLRR